MTEKIKRFSKLDIRVGAIETFLQIEFNKQHYSKESVVSVIIFIPLALNKLISPHSLNNTTDEYMLHNINNALKLLKLKTFNSYKEWNDRIEKEFDDYLDKHEIYVITDSSNNEEYIKNYK